jgi:hypothetical protein
MEAKMSELTSNIVERKDAQSLFAEYNQRYFGGLLPRYKALITNNQSRCERRKRRIYINPQTGDVSVILLHEMVHAAVGLGHGKVWLDEIRRLADLGAPLQEELEKYDPKNEVTLKQLRSEFFDAGLNAPADLTWSDVRKCMGHEWGLTDKDGRAKNRRWSRYLRRARREWSRGRAIANA